MAQDKKLKSSTEKDYGDSDIVKLTLSDDKTQISHNRKRKISATQLVSMPHISIGNNNCSKNEITKASGDRVDGRRREKKIKVEPSNFFSKKKVTNELNEENELLIKSSENIAYSWDSLQLGKGSGSAALRSYVKKGDTVDEVNSDTFEEKSSLTARNIIEMISTLRPKTSLPPPDCKLHQVVQKNRFENAYICGEKDDIDKLLKATRKAGEKVSNANKTAQLKPLPLPFNSLARLYEEMCTQDADDGSSFRRETQYMTPESCVKKLRDFENQISALKIKQNKILSLASQRGLSQSISEDVRSFLGYNKDLEEKSFL